MLSRGVTFSHFRDSEALGVCVCGLVCRARSPGRRECRRPQPRPLKILERGPHPPSELPRPRVLRTDPAELGELVSSSLGQMGKKTRGLSLCPTFVSEIESLATWAGEPCHTWPVSLHWRRHRACFVGAPTVGPRAPEA